MITKTSRTICRRVVAVIGLLVSSHVLPAAANKASLVPAHDGYAFDHPRILVQQRLFGLAHGVTRLAATCNADGAVTRGREAILAAHAEWDKQQAEFLKAMQRDLAHYYFGERADAAEWSDFAAALNLKPQVNLRPGSVEMMAACDTLPETLKKPRYDLRRQFQLQSQASRVSKALVTESRAEACRALAATDDATRLEEALDVWRQTFSAGVDEANKNLESHWADSQLDGTFDEWLTQARGDGKRSATAARCSSLPQWLLSKQADPDDAFNRAP